MNLKIRQLLEDLKRELFRGNFREILGYFYENFGKLVGRFRKFMKVFLYPFRVKKFQKNTKLFVNFINDCKGMKWILWMQFHRLSAEIFQILAPPTLRNVMLADKRE